MKGLRKIVFFVCITCLVLILPFDKFYLDRFIFLEGKPIFSINYIIRSFIVLISVGGLIWSLIGNRKPRFAIRNENGISLERLSILLTLFLAMAILLLFMLRPSIFSALSHEDNIVEYSSSFLLFGCSFITVFSLFKNETDYNKSRYIRLSFAFIAIIFFIMAMEEISWFQRILKIKTPDFLALNIQNEINIHNFQTDYFENLYYFTAFTCLVVFPFFRFLFTSLLKNNYLKTFMPRPYIGIIGSIACAYNFDMWNIVFTQVAFFGSLVILSVFYIFCVVKIDKQLILSSILVTSTTQFLFLKFGDNFQRLWEVTEYKELFIPLGLFIYSCDLLLHAKPSFLKKFNILFQKEEQMLN